MTPASPPRDALARVLVVDDVLSMAEMVADGLSERGYDAIAVGSSLEASKLLTEPASRIDAVVTDLRMPHADGLAILDLSRAQDPARPVLVMTAYSSVDTAIDSIRRGAYHYLTKPFKTDELELFLARGLDEARLRREAATLKRALRADRRLGEGNAAMAERLGLDVETLARLLESDRGEGEVALRGARVSAGYGAIA